MAVKGLNAKQARFVDEYLIDLNATQAAIRAGYASANADVTGPRLLGNVGIAAAIAEGQKRLAEKAGVTAEKIVAELAKLGFSNMQDYVGVTADGSPFVDLSAVDRDKWAAVGEITVDHINKREGDETKAVERVKFKLADKRAALVDLGKHLGMFTDKVQHSGAGGGPIQFTRIELVDL
jgi:phage terminase small subunit